MKKGIRGHDIRADGIEKVWMDLKQVIIQKNMLFP